MQREIEITTHNFIILNHVSTAYTLKNINNNDETLCGIKNISSKSPVWLEMHNNTNKNYLDNLPWICKKCLEKLK